MECLIDANCNENDLFKVLNDYENLSVYLPRQLKSVKIIEENTEHVIIEVTLFFKTLIKKEFSQKIMIKKIGEKELELEVLDGHAKKTKIVISMKTNEDNRMISINCDLKLSLKTAILYPIAKREYVPLVGGIFKRIVLDVNKMERDF